MGRASFRIVALVLVALGGCRCSSARATDPCETPGLGTCADDHLYLLCGKDHRSIEVACRGPRGCVTPPEGRLLFFEEQCDTSANIGGDRCPHGWKDRCADPTHLLWCHGPLEDIAGTIVNAPCLGPRGCRDAECDATISRIGDPCIDTWLGPRDENTFVPQACAADGVTELACRNGSWASRRPCRGARGCRSHPTTDGRDSTHTCDTSLAEVGDACDFEGETACRVDGKSELECRKRAFVVARTCKCTVEHTGDGGRTLACVGG